MDDGESVPTGNHRGRRPNRLTLNVIHRPSNSIAKWLTSMCTGRWSGTKVSSDFRMPVKLYTGDNDAVAIERGPLVFALPIEAEWKKVKDNPQFADWEVYPKSPWNYALEIDPERPRSDR